MFYIAVTQPFIHFPWKGCQFDCRVCGTDQPLLYRVISESTENMSNLRREESVAERAENKSG